MIEKVLEDIKNFLGSNFNTALNEVYSNYSDSLLPFEIKNEDINIQFFDLNNINSKSAILIRANLLNTDNNGTIYKEEYQISVAHCFFVNQNSKNSDLYKHAFRSQRALGNLLAENYDEISQKAKFDVEKLSPEEFEDENGHLIICGAFLNCSLVG